MKAKRIIIVFMLLAICRGQLSSSTSDPITNQNGLESLSWLLGVWENHTPRGVIYESWEAISDKEYFGQSYIVKGQDTMIFETMRLLREADAVLYIPTVKNQNDGMPVVFKSSFLSSSKFIVEAPEHDFPQTISYTRIAEDQFVAEISGLTDAGMRYQTFSMKSNRKSKNIAIIRDVFKYFNDHNWDAMAGLYANPAAFKDPSFGPDAVMQDRDQIIRKYLLMEKQSPDIRDVIKEIYATEEGHVIVEFTASGSNPNGSKWELPLVSIFKIENGLITRESTYYDKP